MALSVRVLSPSRRSIVHPWAHSLSAHTRGDCRTKTCPRPSQRRFSHGCVSTLTRAILRLSRCSSRAARTPSMITSVCAGHMPLLVPLLARRMAGSHARCSHAPRSCGMHCRQVDQRRFRSPRLPHSRLSLTARSAFISFRVRVRKAVLWQCPLSGTRRGAAAIAYSSMTLWPRALQPASSTSATTLS